MSEFERRKDQLQESVQSTAGLVGRITMIITDAVGSITREVGEWISDGIEMQEAARAAQRDADEPGDSPEPSAADDPALPVAAGSPTISGAEDAAGVSGAAGESDAAGESNAAGADTPPQGEPDQS